MKHEDAIRTLAIMNKDALPVCEHMALELAIELFLKVDTLEAELSKERSLSLRYRQQGVALEAELATERARLAQTIKALEVIRGDMPEIDDQGLIDDLTCCYCDGDSVDGCDEDCPREIARAAIDAAMKGSANG